MAKGAVVWLTGLSGAGKSTLTTEVGKQIAGSRDVEVLDGDEIRLYLSQGLGFSREDRDTNGGGSGAGERRAAAARGGQAPSVTSTNALTLASSRQRS